VASIEMLKINPEKSHESPAFDASPINKGLDLGKIQILRRFGQIGLPQHRLNQDPSGDIDH
jgi:hypothetical protein